MPNKGKFIVLDGPDGSGKSTQIKMLAKHLKSEHGITALEVRDPGGTWVGEGIRKLLLTPGGRVSPQAELHLYLASRAQLVEDVIRPGLEKGHWILGDRYCLATVAYQGYGQDRPLKEIQEIRRLCEMATGGLRPDTTLVIDMDPQVGLLRKPTSGQDRMEQKSLAYHEKVRAGFQTEVKRTPGSHLIDGRGTPQQVLDRILAKLKAILPQAKASRN